MKKILVVGLAFLLSAGVAFAGDNASKCIGLGCGNVEGSFKIDTKDIAGGIDASGKIVSGGAAGGISGAGGLTMGQASGEIETINVPDRYTGYCFTKKCTGYFQQNTNGTGRIEYKENFPKAGEGWKFLGTKFEPAHVIAGGTAGAILDTKATGLTKTTSYSINQNGINGVGSFSDSIAETEARLQLNSLGVAHAEGGFFGIAGQGSANGSIMFNHGVTVGLAGQYGTGYILGGGLVAGGLFCGPTLDINAGIDIAGQSYSESYRGTFVNGPAKTEVLGSNVGASTQVTSWGTQDYHNGFLGVSTGFLTGGWQVAGGAAAHTVQAVNGGYASANAVGSYSGSGSLGCNFEGSAIGGTETSVTTVNGYKGSSVTSHAGMQVTAKGTSAPQN